MPFDECNCQCHRSNGMMVHCMPCCSSCGRCHRNIRFGMEKEHEKQCKPPLAPAEQAVVDDAKDIMAKVVARIEESTRQYGTNYVLANVMKETEEELLDIVGWPLLEAIRMRQLFLKKLGQLDGKYLDKFLIAQTTEYLAHLKDKIDTELTKRQ